MKTMTPLEYFKYSIDSGVIKERKWPMWTFGIIIPDTPYTEDGYPYADNDQVVVKIDDDIYAIKPLDDQPMYNKDTKIQLPKGWISSIKEDITTTYGVLLLNIYLFYIPFGDKVEYQNKYLTPGYVNNIAYNLLLKDISTIEEHKLFENGCVMLTILSPLGVPSGSEKSFRSNPAVIKKRDELLKKYKDKLDDPTVIAKIQSELVKMDKEYLKGDPAESGIFSGKTMNMTRYRMWSMYGAEPDFYNETKINVMTQSLREGWKKENLVMLNNAIVAGSYNRAANTALGGAEAKLAMRVFQNFKKVDGDCGSTHGLSIRMDDITYKQYIGRYEVNSKKPMTEEYLKSNIGKTLVIRTPLYCWSEGTTYCRHCLGETLFISEVGLSAQATRITSRFLDFYMALMHTTALKTASYNYKDRIL